MTSGAPVRRPFAQCMAEGTECITGSNGQVPMGRFDAQRRDPVASKNTYARDGVGIQDLASLRKPKAIGEAGPLGRSAHTSVMDTSGVGEQADRALEQVLKHLATEPEVPQALAVVQLGQCPVRVAVGLELDTRLLHLEDLVKSQRPRRPSAGWYGGPVHRPAFRRQCLGNQEHRGGQAEATKDRERVLIHPGKAIVHGQRGVTLRQAAGSVEQGYCLGQVEESPMGAEPGHVPYEEFRLQGQRSGPVGLYRVVAEDCQVTSRVVLEPTSFRGRRGGFRMACSNDRSARARPPRTLHARDSWR
jgi:hypothetical protein